MKCLSLFQADGPKLGFLAAETDRLLRKVLMKFVLAKVIREQEDITTISFTISAHQHAYTFIAVGTEARLYLADIEDDLEQGVKPKFFRCLFPYFIFSVMLQ